METQLTDLRIKKQLDSFIKRVICNEIRNAAKENQRQLHMEISLTDLSIEPKAQADQYYIGTVKINAFNCSVKLEDDSLAEAIQMLKPYAKDIIILYYIYGLTDKEIAHALKRLKNSVQRTRAAALKQLKTYLGATL